MRVGRPGGEAHPEVDPPVRTGRSLRWGRVAGMGFGSAFAVLVSWTVNHSVVWALIHGILGWLYLIAYALGWTTQWTPT